METLIFATNNKNKIEEIKCVTEGLFSVITLADAGINIEIPEPHNSLEENALEKSSTIFKLTKQNCFSEDTGLEVDALNNAPGVKSARYAGENANSEENIDKLLQKLLGVTNRSARFRTIISLIYKENQYFFEGVCEGKILKERKGSKGFGYDAIFAPNFSTKCFAEMEIEEKNQFSHRKKAVKKLIDFLLVNEKR